MRILQGRCLLWPGISDYRIIAEVQNVTKTSKLSMYRELNYRIVFDTKYVSTTYLVG